MTRQNQSVAEGGSAIQTTGNVNIVQQMSAAQMSEIMVEIAIRLHGYIAQSEEKFLKRCNDLREEILQKFSQLEAGGVPEAFTSPDFQFVLRSAHEAYGRSGDADLKQELVQLLIKRSQQEDGSRTAFVINNAISLVANLTKEERSGLVFLFVFSYVKFGIRIREDLYQSIQENLRYFEDSAPKNYNSYSYLESLGCLTVSGIGERDFIKLISTNYMPYMQNDLIDEEIFQALDSISERAKQFPFLLRVQHGGALRFAVENRDALKSMLDENGFNPTSKANILSLYDKKVMKISDFQIEFERKCSAAVVLRDLGARTQIKNCALNTTGIAIAHSILEGRGLAPFPLEDAVG